MRKFTLCSLAIFAGACLTANADGPKPNVTLQSKEYSGQVKHAQRYARIAFSADMKTVTAVGPWIEAGMAGRDNGFCSDHVAFDSLDALWDAADPNNPILESTGVNMCALALTNRYYFGATYNNPNSLDDMQVAAADEGAESFETLMAINKETATQTYIVLATFDEVGLSGDPNAPIACSIASDPTVPAAGGLGGFILDYGVAGTPNGWTLFIASICGNPDGGWIMPSGADGGAVLTRVFQSGTDTDGDGFPDEFVAADLAVLTQPMLWENDNVAGGTGVVTDRPGSSSLIHWDDDSTFPLPPDGIIDPASECYGYIFTLTCPNEQTTNGINRGTLGSALQFLVGEGPPGGCPGDVDGDGDVDLQDLATLLANFGGAGPLGDLDGDGDVDLQDLATLLANFGQPCP